MSKVPQLPNQLPNKPTPPPSPPRKYDVFITEISITENNVTIYWHDRIQPFFGSVQLSKTKDGKIKMDTEAMSKKFVKYLLGLIVDEGEVV